MDVFDSFLQATVRTATPLLFAALGELAVQRAGLINIGLEGIIIAGALGALAGADAGGILAGYASAGFAGLLVALVFAVFTLLLRANQIVTGTAITLLGLGATGTIYRATYGVPGQEITIGATTWTLPWLSELPVVGKALFGQSAITYALFLLLPVFWFFLYRTHSGLSLRAVGENPEAAVAAGIQPRTVQLGAVLFGGVMGGVAGGALVIAQVGSFAEGMSAGRGFIAIAIVALGRWHPVGVALASLLFGGANALQFLLQSMGWGLPYQLFLALPYALTLITLALSRRRFLAPAALATSPSG